MLRRWLIRQILIAWLRDRALLLPQSRREEIADRLGVPVDIIAQVEQAIRERIIALVEEF